MAGLALQLEFGGGKFFARKVQDSASPLLRQTATPIPSRRPIKHQWHQKCHGTFRHEAVTRAHLPSKSLPGGAFVRRDDLLKPDVMSEVILLGAGVLVFAILILILVVALTQTSAPV
jgi:hypothetical protein